jgi:lipopolysaccharide heptosyltransferase I
MAAVLFIKTSSLGDVIHHMPALTEAQRQRPDARFSWVVEEAFAPLVRLHPAVTEVISVASRRWRKSIWNPATMMDVGGAYRRLRARPYDEIVDTQGLARSAVLARIARGRRHGYDRDSIKERLASALYDVRHKVSRDLHAIERNRRLTGLALGYEPRGEPHFGLDRARFRTAGERTVLLLHGTARPAKEWPEDNWIALGRTLAARGLTPILPWGNERERASAERIGRAVGNSRVPARVPLDEVVRLIASVEAVVGVDTGLLHLAAALGMPLVAIFAGSRPELTAPIGKGPMRVLGEYGKSPSFEEVEAAAAQLPNG